MFCHRCGFGLPVGALFCPKCGASQHVAAEPGSREGVGVGAVAASGASTHQPWVDRYEVIWSVGGALVSLFVFNDGFLAAAWLLFGLLVWPGIAWLWREAGHDEVTTRKRRTTYVAWTVAALAVGVAIALANPGNDRGASPGQTTPDDDVNYGAYVGDYQACTEHTSAHLASIYGVSNNYFSVSDAVAKAAAAIIGGDQHTFNAARQGCLDAFLGRRPRKAWP